MQALTGRRSPFQTDRRLFSAHASRWRYSAHALTIPSGCPYRTNTPKKTAILARYGVHAVTPHRVTNAEPLTSRQDRGRPVVRRRDILRHVLPIGDNSVVETLQQFSTGSLVNMVWFVIGLWAIWPIACCLLGAQRGQAFQGFVHGLLWGPIGLPIVLLSSRKHICPTCGKRTLSHPVDAGRQADRIAMQQRDELALPRLPAVPPTARPATIEPERDRSSPPAPPPPPPVYENLAAHAELAAAPIDPPSKGSGASQAESDKLLAWVNGE